MNEDDLARRIINRLDQSLTELPADIVRQLADTRKHALRAHMSPMTWRIQLAEWIGGHRIMLRVALPTLFLLVAAGAVFFLPGPRNQEPFAVEAALLADELPIHAYTDPGFDAWLRHTSQERD